MNFVLHALLVRRYPRFFRFLSPLLLLLLLVLPLSSVSKLRHLLLLPSGASLEFVMNGEKGCGV